MGTIVEQLELNYTFFVHAGLFAFLFLVLSFVYFKPFMKLFEARTARTVHDREVADKLMEQAQSKFDEFKHRMAEERAAARKEYELRIKEAQLEEERLLSNAWADSRKITAEAAEAAMKQRETIKKQVSQDVELLAQTISERLLARRE